MCLIRKAEIFLAPQVSQSPSPVGADAEVEELRRLVRQQAKDIAKLQGDSEETQSLLDVSTFIFISELLTHLLIIRHERVSSERLRTKSTYCKDSQEYFFFVSIVLWLEC